MKHNHPKFLYLLTAMLLTTACGSNLGLNGSSSGTGTGAPSSGSGGAPCGNGNASAGNGNATSGNGNTSAVPTSWTYVAASQAVGGNVYSNGNGTFYGSGSTTQERTVDDGNTWTAVPANDSNCYVDLLTSDSNVVYGNCSTDGESQTEGTLTGISRDGGATWKIVKVGFGIDAVSPIDPNTAYGHEEHHGTPVFTGSYVTHDGGTTWATVTNDSNAFVTAIGPSSSDLYASTYNGTTEEVVYSHDGGASWTTVPFKGDGVKLSPTNSNVVYADAEDVGLDVSRDGGATWNTVYFSCVNHTVVSAWDPNFLFVMTCENSGASPEWSFLGTTDGGANWKTVPTPSGCPIINEITFDASQKAVFAECDNGLYRASAQ